MQRRNLVVAIDGPSGSGKSTVARKAAIALGLRYLDTGAMYRAVTWLVLRNAVDVADPTAIGQVAAAATLQITTDPQAPQISADGVDVTAAVRGSDVTTAVSAVSAVPEVRRTMLERQRAIIGDGGIVVEGRDIGTTVTPDAAVKVFLTADPATRAARRTRQEGAASDGRSAVAATQADLDRRDAADSTRTTSPLQQAPDALVIDSSAQSVEQVVAAILEAAGAAVAG